MKISLCHDEQRGNGLRPLAFAPGPKTKLDLNKKAVPVARKPRDTAAVLFGLKFADNIHYKFKSIANLRKADFRAPNISAQNRS